MEADFLTSSTSTRPARKPASSSSLSQLRYSSCSSLVRPGARMEYSTDLLRSSIVLGLDDRSLSASATGTH